MSDIKPDSQELSKEQQQEDLRILKASVTDDANSPVAIFVPVVTNFTWEPALNGETKTIALVSNYGENIDNGCIVYNPAYIHKLVKEGDFGTFYAIIATIGLAIKCGYYDYRNGSEGFSHTKAVQIMMAHSGIYNTIKGNNAAFNTAISALAKQFEWPEYMGPTMQAFLNLNTTAVQDPNDPTGQYTIEKPEFTDDDWNLETIRKYLSIALGGKSPQSLPQAMAGAMSQAQQQAMQQAKQQQGQQGGSQQTSQWGSVRQQPQSQGQQQGGQQQSGQQQGGQQSGQQQGGQQSAQEIAKQATEAAKEAQRGAAACARACNSKAGQLAGRQMMQASAKMMKSATDYKNAAENGDQQGMETAAQNMQSAAQEIQNAKQQMQQAMKSSGAKSADGEKAMESGSSNCQQASESANSAGQQGSDNGSDQQGSSGQGADNGEAVKEQASKSAQNARNAAAQCAKACGGSQDAKNAQKTIEEGAQKLEEGANEYAEGAQNGDTKKMQNGVNKMKEGNSKIQEGTQQMQEAFNKAQQDGGQQGGDQGSDQGGKQGGKQGGQQGGKQGGQQGGDDGSDQGGQQGGKQGGQQGGQQGGDDGSDDGSDQGGQQGGTQGGKQGGDQGGAQGGKQGGKQGGQQGGQQGGDDGDDYGDDGDEGDAEGGSFGGSQGGKQGGKQGGQQGGDEGFPSGKQGGQQGGKHGGQQGGDDGDDGELDDDGFPGAGGGFGGGTSASNQEMQSALSQLQQAAQEAQQAANGGSEAQGGNNNIDSVPPTQGSGKGQNDEGNAQGGEDRGGDEGFPGSKGSDSSEGANGSKPNLGEDGESSDPTGSGSSSTIGNLGGMKINLMNEIEFKQDTRKITGMNKNLAEFANEQNAFSQVNKTTSVGSNTGGTMQENLGRVINSINTNIETKMEHSNDTEQQRMQELNALSNEQNKADVAINSKAHLTVARKILRAAQAAQMQSNEDSEMRNERRPTSTYFQTGATHRLENEVPRVLLAIDASGSMWFNPNVLVGAANLLSSLVNALNMPVDYAFWDETCDIPQPYTGAVAKSLADGTRPHVHQYAGKLQTSVGGGGTNVYSVVSRLSRLDDNRKPRFDAKTIAQHKLKFADNYNLIIIYSDFEFPSNYSIPTNVNDIKRRFGEVRYNKLVCVCCSDKGENYYTPQTFKKLLGQRWISYKEWQDAIDYYSHAKK